MRDFVAHGHHIGNKPNPGVYAESNSSASPALTAFGEPVEHSVNRVLRVRGRLALRRSLPGNCRAHHHRRRHLRSIYIRARSGAPPSWACLANKRPITTPRSRFEPSDAGTNPASADEVITAAETTRTHTEKDGGRVMDLMYYVVLAIVLFVVGGATVLTRRNSVIALLGVEIMLNSCNLVLITSTLSHVGRHRGGSSRSSSWSLPRRRS